MHTVLCLFLFMMQTLLFPENLAFGSCLFLYPGPVLCEGQDPPVIHLPISYWEDWLSFWHMVLWIIVQSLELIIRGPEEFGNLLTATAEWLWMTSCLHNGFYLFLSFPAEFEFPVRVWRWEVSYSPQPQLGTRLERWRMHISSYLVTNLKICKAWFGGPMGPIGTTKDYARPLGKTWFKIS